MNLGLRWAYTSPLVEKDNRQINFDLVTGQQIFASDGSIEERALYKPYYKGFEPRLGAAWTLDDKWVVRGGYGISQFMEGTGANLRLPLNPPFFFESAVDLRRDNRAGHARHRLRRAWCPARRRPATCAPTIRTCARSSRSSGTRSWSTSSRRRCRRRSATSGTMPIIW